MFRNFVSKQSLVPAHYKLGQQITTYIRLRDQSSTLKALPKGMVINLLEMYSIGYDISLGRNTLLNLANKGKFWHDVGNCFFVCYLF